MKNASSFLAVAVLSTVATVAAAAPSEATTARQTAASTAATTPTGYQQPGVRGAKAAAAKGPTALRLYIQRTRMIFGLRYEDYMQP